MPGDTAKDLVVRLAFEHGDTRQQISAITNELKLLDSGLAASAAMAAGFSGTLNQAKAESAGLKQAVGLQRQMVEKYGEAIAEANERLKKSTQAHEEQGQRIEALKAKQAALTAEKEKLAAAMAAEKKAAGDNSMAYLEMDARMDALKEELKQTADALDKEEAAFARSDKAINRNAQAVQKLTTQQNKAKESLAEMEKRLKNHAPAWEAAAKAADKFAEASKTAGQWQTSAGQKLTKVSTAILGLGYAAGQAAIDWESQFAGVRKTVNGTEEDLQRIHDALLDMQVPTDYGDLAEIAANAGQLGIATPNVVEFTRTMADLAETTDLTADAAASGFAQYANITQMPQENIGRLGSVTVELGNNLATTESKIVDFAQAIGAAGSQAGMTDQQIFGISGGLASLGLEAQAGGTAFSKAIIGMKVAAETGSKDLQDYAKVAGMTVQQFKESFSADAAGTFIRFVQGLSTGSESAVVMLDEMGITETRLRDTLLRASNASDLLTRSVNMANSAWAENTALANEASVRYGTTASKMAMTGKQAQRVAMDFGNAIMPYLSKGLEGVQGIIDKFNGLSDAQRDGIVRWGAYAAAVGPALTVLGKANTALGSAAAGFSQLASVVAEGGGLSGFTSALGGLLGPAGILALIGGLALATAKLYDYASGAKAAREAQAALNETARTWIETQATTLYDTGTADPLARFGLTKDAFGTSKAEAQSWMDDLVATWTDGKAETNQIVKQFADGFREGSDDVRGAIEGQRDLLSEYGALTPEARANLDKDLQQLDAYDKEVAALLKKRQNGTLTEEDQQRLNEIVQARTEIQLKYELDTDGYDQVVTQMRAEIERLRAAGQEGGDTSGLMGDAMNALAEGRKAYMDALNGSYDAEYAQIQQIEDETARQAALNALNERYNEQRLQGEEAYADAVREAGAEAWEQGGYEDQVKQIDALVAALGDAENLDVPSIAEMAEGLDEGKLTSMLALVEQLKAAGMSDQQLMDLGIDVDDLEAKIQAIRDLTAGVEGLEGLNEMFGSALPEELQRILVGLDMTQAAADWAAFAEGGDLQPITPTLGEIDAAGAVVTGTIVADGELGTVTGADGKTYKVVGATVRADGTLATVTAENGVTYTVTDGDVRADGTLGTVTGEDGKKYVVSGVKAQTDGELGTVTGADGVTYKVVGATVSADGTLATVTAENGVTYTVDGANVVVNGTVVGGTGLSGATASVTLNPLDRAAVAAWEAENSGVSLTGPKAKVGVQLGAGWQEELQAAYNTGLLQVYGADGARLEVTPEVLKQITATDVALVGEDGTIHVIVTPEVGSAEGVAQSTQQMNATPLDGTVLQPLTTSAQETIEHVNTLNGQMAQLQERADALRESGNIYDETGESLPELESRVQNTRQAIDGMVSDLNEDDLAAIGGQIANLMAALAGGEGTPEQMAEWQAQLQELLTFVDGIDPNAYTSTGSGVMEGIAQGMASYGWSGDAGSVSSAIQSAINAALQINSPSKVMNPTGSGVSEGIAQGMTEYSFAGDAAQVAAAIAGAFGSLGAEGRSAGRSFSAGLATGIRAGQSGVISAAIQVAQAAARAAREALDIHSPSKVTEGFGEMFDLGFVKGIEKELPTISRAVERALYPSAPQGAGTVVNQSTDSRDMRVNNAIQVQELHVRDEGDVQGVADALYQLVRRDQKMIGAR